MSANEIGWSSNSWDFFCEDQLSRFGSLDMTGSGGTSTLATLAAGEAGDDDVEDGDDAGDYGVQD